MNGSASAGAQRARDGLLRANVVDIRRFSTHDGRGIRTTVFIKGCSLACGWCQNPETIRPRLGPVFFAKKCIDCGLCLPLSRNGEMTRGPDGMVAHLEVEGEWEELAAVCPTGAIALNGRSYTVDELVDVVMADRAFFGHGGGVTLSGGEPLLVPHFAAAVFARLRDRGIHTAVETALNVRTEFVLEAAPLVDQFFADLKIIDPEDHRRWTGHTNERILDNLRVLLTSPWRDRVIVRTPLIPGVTATDENIAGIAGFITDLYPDVHYELLNYNPLAIAKYELVTGHSFLFTEQTNPKRYTAQQMEHFRRIAADAGVRNLVED
ncbi:activating enzymes, group 2 [Propionibacterium ruminifibrarum]|uniref:Activating enzymes, group 2 n=1 Tax=Propionibacterium ruminifibrarum TaxID=1962131 RepID=A0A375I6V7_9ACTN|nr:glycyl-radical enzyme activating protein [Propionibacterium ruminifibrarum]SPF68982.1 activating enzymes, group 2 [Propionibacterium ruminifibrarum]